LTKAIFSGGVLCLRFELAIAFLTVSLTSCLLDHCPALGQRKPQLGCYKQLAPDLQEALLALKNPLLFHFSVATASSPEKNTLSTQLLSIDLFVVSAIVPPETTLLG
jgi:hypothetical protein